MDKLEKIYLKICRGQVITEQYHTKTPREEQEEKRAAAKAKIKNEILPILEELMNDESLWEQSDFSKADFTEEQLKDAIKNIYELLKEDDPDGDNVDNALNSLLRFWGEGPVQKKVDKIWDIIYNDAYLRSVANDLYGGDEDEDDFDDESYLRQQENMAAYIHSGAGLDNYYDDQSAGYVE